MTKAKLGNRIIILILATAMAVMAFFVQWGVVTITEDSIRESSVSLNGQKLGNPAMGELLGGAMSSMLLGLEVPVTGTTGHLALGPLKIPYWIPISATILGLLLTATNWLQVSEVPRKLIVSLLLAGAAAGVWAMIAIISAGSLGVGALLLVAASILGITQQGRSAL